MCKPFLVNYMFFVFLERLLSSSPAQDYSNLIRTIMLQNSSRGWRGVKILGDLVGRGAKRPWVAPFLEKLYVFYFSPLNSLLLSTDVNHFGKTTYVFIFCVTLSVCVCNCLCMIFSETQGVTSRHTTWTSPLKWVVQFLLLSSHMRVVWFFQPIKTSLFYFIIV